MEIEFCNGIVNVVSRPYNDVIFRHQWINGIRVRVFAVVVFDYGVKLVNYLTFFGGEICVSRSVVFGVVL